jgi:hypothetical protein
MSFSDETELPKSGQVEETVLQDIRDRFVATRQQGRALPTLTPFDSFRPVIYLRTPVVSSKSNRRRVASGREPATVLLGPFFSEIEARFIKASAQGLGLVVERIDLPSLRASHWHLHADRIRPTRINSFPKFI